MDVPLAFSTFRPAKILQTFGRSVTTNEANIFLKNSTLVFKENGKVKQAYMKNIIGAVFDDSIRYVTLDSIMGRLVSQRGRNKLVCVTTIDMDRYKSLTTGGENLPFFQIEELNLFLDIDGDKRPESKGLPLKYTYYFIVNGTIYPANEKTIKKLVRPEMKAAFKHLMYDKFWSWKDAASLTQLFVYLPE